MAKRLDVAEILSTSVSNLNTPTMQVVEIPLDKLLDNEGNFFSVEDVQELADDIAAWEIPEEAVEETRALLFRCPTCGKYRVFFDLD